MASGSAFFGLLSESSRSQRSSSKPTISSTVSSYRGRHSDARTRTADVGRRSTTERPTTSSEMFSFEALNDSAGTAARDIGGLKVKDLNV